MPIPAERAHSVCSTEGYVEGKRETTEPTFKATPTTRKDAAKQQKWMFCFLSSGWAQSVHFPLQVAECWSIGIRH